jgi:hypothetical protein
VAIGHEAFLTAPHNPLAAWETISATGVPDPEGSFGVMFPTL